jgi:hypothetical protein
METGSKLRLADVFVSISDPRQAGKVEHDLVELLVVAVNGVLVGADTFVRLSCGRRNGWIDCAATCGWKMAFPRTTFRAPVRPD